MKTAPEYSVIVPVFNAGSALEQLVERSNKVLTKEMASSCEIILVNDGSNSPETKKLLARLASLNNVFVIHLTRNFGKPGAIMCGLHHSRGDRVITIDDDLQQRPEDLPKLIEHGEHDVVIGSHKKKSHGIFQRATSATKHLFDRFILGYDTPLGPMKLYRRHVVDGMLRNQSNKPFIPALIKDVTDDIVSVNVPHDPSAYPKSRYTFRTRWRQFTNLLFGNSVVVMKLIATTGLVMMVLSLLFAFSIVIRKLIGIPTETGWSSIMVTILLIGGLNLGATGIIGQYFIRILDLSSNKPAYLVREIVGQKANKNNA